MIDEEVFVPELLRVSRTVKRDPAIAAWFAAQPDVFAAHVTVGFYQGSSLPDRARLLKGTGKHMRHVTLKPGAALDQSALEDLISAAHSHIRMRLMFGD